MKEQYSPEFIDALEYRSKMESLGGSGILRPSASVFDAIAEYYNSGRAKADMRMYDRASGRLIRSASSLEREVAVLLGGVTVPDDPVQYYGAILSMSAYERSDVLRKALARSKDWKRFVNEVQEVAVLRNRLAHGDVSLFDLAEGGESVRFGWFVTSYVRSKSPNPWKLRRVEVTRQSLRDARRRAYVLGATAEAVLHVTVASKLEGNPQIPHSLRYCVPLLRGERHPWITRIADEMFGPMDPDVRRAFEAILAAEAET